MLVCCIVGAAGNVGGTWLLAALQDVRRMKSSKKQAIRAVGFIGFARWNEVFCLFYTRFWFFIYNGSMPILDPTTYLSDLVRTLRQQWPENRTVNIACHGHSVPAGYFATPLVSTFDAYPHLLHRGLKERFPFAVINVVVTAIGGETSDRGAARFERDVLGFLPDVVTIDYGLNDRRIGLELAETSWRKMIERAVGAGAKVILLTPTMDAASRLADGEDVGALRAHTEQIRSLALEYSVGLADSYAAFKRYMERGGDLSDLLSWPNHPNRRGHELVAEALMRWFPAL